MHLAPFADALCAMDLAWWKRYHKGLQFEGERWTSSRQAADSYRLRHAGYSATHKNSGLFAMRLALEWGAEKVILLGYDMKLGDGGNPHFHGPHDGLGNPTAKRLAEACIEFHRHADPRIINSSRDTALKFPRVPLALALS